MSDEWDDFDASPSAPREVARGCGLTVAFTAAATAAAVVLAALMGALSPLLLALVAMALLPVGMLLGLVQWVWLVPVAFVVGARHGWARAMGVGLGGFVVLAIHALAMVAAFQR